MAKKWIFLVLLPFLLFLLPSSGVLAQTTTLSGSFTYQGYLTGATGPVNLACDFQFGLFTALSGGTQVGSTQPKNNVAVNNGVFNVVLDFGTIAFNGTDRYLDIQVRCPTTTGIAGYTPLIPRQAITPTPYAIALYGLRTEQTIYGPNIIGGVPENAITPGVVGATISGGGAAELGYVNRITDHYNVIGGGAFNRAGDDNGNLGDAFYATVDGGRQNTASHRYASVGGGYLNSASGSGAMVGGGEQNIASGAWGMVGGGEQNTASHQYASVGGGYLNSASGPYATVGGGGSNIASGNVATVAGGFDNNADGDYSFAAGRRAKASHDGAFVWADSTDADFSANLANQFFVRATGGVAFYTNSTLTNGCTLSTGGGTWNCTSDRNTKEDFAAVDSQAVLTSVLNMPITTWVYSGTATRHIGPMAQDFYASFAVGEDERHISMIDADGVALAAIQGLYQVVQDKDAQIANLQTQLDDLNGRLAVLEGLATPSQAGLNSPLLLVMLAAAGLGGLGWRATRKEQH